MGDASCAAGHVGVLCEWCLDEQTYYDKKVSRQSKPPVWVCVAEGGASKCSQSGLLVFTGGALQGLSLLGRDVLAFCAGSQQRRVFNLAVLLTSPF